MAKLLSNGGIRNEANVKWIWYLRGIGTQIQQKQSDLLLHYHCLQSTFRPNLEPQICIIFTSVTKLFKSIFSFSDRDFTMPCLCQFTEILRCPAWVNLQRFHNAPLVSIYRDFMMPCLRQFTEILGCPACVNLQRFYDALFASIYRDFIMPCLCQFT